MNSIEKKNLITAIQEGKTSKKIKEKHVDCLIQIITDLKLESKIIKEIKVFK